MGSRIAPALIRYTVRRIVLAIPTLAGIVLAVFLLLHLAPGDPASAAGRFAGRRVSPTAAAALRRTYGLDRPIGEQLLSWSSRAVRLDFGESFQDHRPVSSRILEALPYTVVLNVAALLLALAVAVPLGVEQARRAGSAFDQTMGGFLFLLYSLPSFWMAMILLSIFAVRLRWFPLFGISSGAGFSWLDRLRHLALPLVCLTYGGLAFFTRMVRTSVREASALDFVLAARARGLSQSQALWRHAFRNALLPLITLLGLLIPGLLSGSVVVEQVFAWPGLGRLYFDAVLSRDYPLILGLTFFTSVLTLISMLAADILYAAADPRVRLE